MARTGSVRTECNARRQNHIAVALRRDMVRPSCARVSLCALIASLAWTTTCAGQTGPTIGLKIGAQTLEDPITLEKTARHGFWRLKVNSSRNVGLLPSTEYSLVLSVSLSPLM
jgi:hypothetical protein